MASHKPVGVRRGRRSPEPAVGILPPHAEGQTSDTPPLAPILTHRRAGPGTVAPTADGRSTLKGPARRRQVAEMGQSRRRSRRRRRSAPRWHRVAVPLVVLSLIATAAIVITMTRVGPAVIVFESGLGLHVLDVAVLAVVLPVIVLLLRGNQPR